MLKNFLELQKHLHVQCALVRSKHPHVRFKVLRRIPTSHYLLTNLQENSKKTQPLAIPTSQKFTVGTGLTINSILPLVHKITFYSILHIYSTAR